MQERSCFLLLINKEYPKQFTNKGQWSYLGSAKLKKTIKLSRWKKEFRQCSWDKKMNKYSRRLKFQWSSYLIPRLPCLSLYLTHYIPGQTIWSYNSLSVSFHIKMKIKCNSLVVFWPISSGTGWLKISAGWDSCLYLLLVFFSVQLLLLCAEMNRKSYDESWLVEGMSWVCFCFLQWGWGK